MSDSSSDKAKLNELKRKTGKLQSEYKALQGQLEKKQAELAAKEREVLQAEAQSQEIVMKTKRLEGQESALDEVIKALKVGQEVTKEFESSIAEEQRKMNKTIRTQYDRIQSFKQELEELKKKKNEIGVGTEDLDLSLQEQLMAIVKKVKDVISDKKTGAQKENGVTPQTGSSGPAPVRRRGGRPPGSTNKKRSSTSATPKRKRDSSESVPRTTPVRSARKARTYYQESESESENMSE